MVVGRLEVVYGSGVGDGWFQERNLRNRDGGRSEKVQMVVGLPGNGLHQARFLFVS